VQVKGTTVVASEALGLTADPPPETAATLVNGDVAFDATLTVAVIGGYEPPAPMGLVVVQLLVVQVQALLVLVMDTTDMPLGGFSATVTGPLVGPDDAPLPTTMV
jgi:hypothetical protein